MNTLQLVTEGLFLGLTLTILVGPLFVALTQSSIESGTRAGITVGVGIWFSDFSIITACYFFIHRLSKIIEDHSFTYWMGLLGGFILITFGIGTFLSRSKYDPTQPRQKLSRKNYLEYFTKGFLVNTINPFTFVFWIGVISTYVLGRGITPQEGIVFFGSIMFVIISTDTAKVLLAKILRARLKAEHIDMFSKVAGVALFLFGIALLVRVGVI